MAKEKVFAGLRNCESFEEAFRLVECRELSPEERIEALHKWAMQQMLRESRISKRLTTICHDQLATDLWSSLHRSAIRAAYGEQVRFFETKRLIEAGKNAVTPADDFRRRRTAALNALRNARQRIEALGNEVQGLSLLWLVSLLDARNLRGALQDILVKGGAAKRRRELALITRGASNIDQVLSDSRYERLVANYRVPNLTELLSAADAVIAKAESEKRHGKPHAVYIRALYPPLNHSMRDRVAFLSRICSVIFAKPLSTQDVRKLLKRQINEEKDLSKTLAAEAAEARLAGVDEQTIKQVFGIGIHTIRGQYLAFSNRAK